MTVASLLGPYKRPIKFSSDIDLNFYIILSDFFLQEKRSFSDSKHIEPPQRFCYHNPCSYVVRWMDSQAQITQKIDHTLFVVII